MHLTRYPLTLPLVTGVLAAAALLAWIFIGLEGSLASSIAVRVPGTDARPEQTEAPYVPIADVCTLTSLDGAAADIPGSWPRFRGPAFDAIVTDPTPLREEWPPAGPPR